MDLARENQAVRAYLKILETKGAGSAALLKRSLFLEKLIINLAGRDLDGNEYRQAVELLMETVPADDWHDCLTGSR